MRVRLLGKINTRLLCPLWDTSRRAAPLHLPPPLPKPRDMPANIRYMALISTRTETAMAGHDHTTDHRHGTMPVRDQEKTFAAFIRFVSWGIGLSIGILIFLALVNA
jgi:hypothetical protein